MKRSILKLRKAGRSSSIVGRRVASRGGSTRVAAAWAPPCQKKEVGLNVRRDQASLTIPPGINSPETKHCRLTHEGEGKDANIQAPNSKATQHLPVPEGADLSSDSRRQAHSRRYTETTSTRPRPRCAHRY